MGIIFPSCMVAEDLRAIPALGTNIIVVERQ